MTRAQPKVAAYPFTTLEPVLGTIDADDRQLVLADIPGLIEGASGGAGPRPRLPRARRAHAAARARAGPRAARRLRSRAQLRGDRARAGRARPAAGRRCRGCWRCRRPTSCRPRWPRRPPREWRDAGRVPGPRDLQRDRGSGWTSCAASCSSACRSPSPSPRASGEDEVAEFAVFRPAKAQDVRDHPRAGRRLDRHRRVRRAPDHALGPRERGGAGARRAAPAAHGRDRARSSEAGFEPGDDVEIGGIVVRARSLVGSLDARRGRQARLVDRRRGHRRAAAVGRRAHLRGGRGAARAPGSTWSSSPRARSRAASTCWGWTARPRAVEELQAASAPSARAGCTGPTTSTCASAASSRPRCC